MMPREEVPLSPEQVPEQARDYLDALRQFERHDLVKSHFHQVAWFKLVDPVRGHADFFALEFRSGLKAALIWTDWCGTWYAGPWLQLSHPDADLTCPPSQLSMSYFQGTPPDLSLIDAIEVLAASLLQP